MITTICPICGEKYELGTNHRCKTKNKHIKKLDSNNKTRSEEIIHSIKWKKFRKRILRRDHFLCQRCLIKYNFYNADNLTVHHIIARIHSPELSFEPNNLITLCQTCNSQLGVKDKLDFKWDAVKANEHFEKWKKGIFLAGRKRKPAALKKGKSETKEHLNERAEVESDIRGDDDLVYGLSNLPEGAQEYYNIIVESYKSVKILSNLDIPLIKEISYVCSRLDQVESLINEESLISPVMNKKTGEVEYWQEHSLYNLENKLLKQFTTLAGQLGMSPSSRAQLAELKMQNQAKEEDPLNSAIAGVDSDDEEE